MSYGGSIPYWPFRDLLRSWLGVARRRAGAPGPRRAPRDGRPALRRALGRHRPVPRGAARALPRARRRRRRIDELSPEALQYRTFEVVRHLRSASPTTARSPSRSRTSTGPTRRRSSCWSGWSPTPRTAAAAGLHARPERDHPSWRLKERRRPHASPPVPRGRARGAVGRRRTRAADGARRRRHAPGPTSSAASSSPPKATRSSWRSSSARWSTPARWSDGGRGWRFDHEVDAPGPADGREGDPGPHRPARPPAREAPVAASVLGRPSACRCWRPSGERETCARRSAS